MPVISLRGVQRSRSRRPRSGPLCDINTASGCCPRFSRSRKTLPSGPDGDSVSWLDTGAVTRVAVPVLFSAVRLLVRSHDLHVSGIVRSLHDDFTPSSPNFHDCRCTFSLKRRAAADSAACTAPSNHTFVTATVAAPSTARLRCWTRA